MKRVFLSVNFMLMFLFACSGYRTGTIEKDYSGFIKFTGNTENVVVVLDEKTEFPLEAEIELYKVKPGQYNIKIYRDDQLIVERIIIIEKQSTYEINLP